VEFEMIQILKPDGTVKDKKSEPKFSKDELLKMYKSMLLIRSLDERGMNMQRSGKIGFYVPSFGQEACQVGAAYNLKKDDWLFPSYRDVGMALVRGASLKSIFDQCYGNAEDLVQGRQMPNHFSFHECNFVSISSPLGTQISQAAGAGMAAQMILKDKNVILTSFGDGTTSTNDFHSGMTFASVYKAPVVFFCQNNQWAISTKVDKQLGSKTVVEKSGAYGMPGVLVDGNDVFAVHGSIKTAFERARKGQGPTLIEAYTYRMGPHSSSDDPTRYRDDAEYKRWQKLDPIERFKKYLVSTKLLTEKEDEIFWKDARDQVFEAAKESEKVPMPAKETLFRDVYSKVPKALRAQYEDLVAEERELGVSVDNTQAFPL